MRFKNRLMFIFGCVGLLALSIPALSRPLPHGLSHKPVAVQKNKILLHAAKGHASARVAREDRTNRLVSQRISETPKRPAFGWPALVSEARKYIGTNPTARTKLWCATFMNLVLAKVGYAGTHSDAAKSFAQYGHRISEPKVGAIAVLTRGRNGGHVGVVSGIDQDGNPIIISGNHGHQVGEAIYPRSRVIAYVMPSDRGPETTQLAARSQPASEPNRPAPERHIESPIAELIAAIMAEPSRQERPSQQTAQTKPPEPRPVAQQEPPKPVEPRRVVQQDPPKSIEPHRTVQQTPEPPPTYQRAGSDNRAIAELLGLKARAQDRSRQRSVAAPPPRAEPVRQRVVQLNRPGRAAGTDTGLAGAFSFR